MELFLTHHAKQRIEERWKNKQIRPHELAQMAWDKGKFPNDKRMRLFFIKWATKNFNIMPEVRVFQGYEFVFENKEYGKVRLVTVLDPDWETKIKKQRRLNAYKYEVRGAKKSQLRRLS